MRSFSPHERCLREAVVSAAQTMNERTNNRGHSGNVSARLALDGFDGLLVTPSGMRYEALGTDDIVAVALDGSIRADESRVPSSECPFHCAIYAARADVSAIVEASIQLARVRLIRKEDAEAVGEYQKLLLEHGEESVEGDKELDALQAHLVSQFSKFVSLVPYLPDELQVMAMQVRLSATSFGIRMTAAGSATFSARLTYEKPSW